MTYTPKFTPGPWKVHQSGLSVESHHNNSYYSICQLQNIDMPSAINNAALISAAPEMYEVLSQFEIVECSTCYGSGLDEDADSCLFCGGAGERIKGGWPFDIKQALAKARGEEAGEN